PCARRPATLSVLVVPTGGSTSGLLAGARASGRARPVESGPGRADVRGAAPAVVCRVPEGSGGAGLRGSGGGRGPPAGRPAGRAGGSRRPRGPGRGRSATSPAPGPGRGRPFRRHRGRAGARRGMGCLGGP